MEQIVNVKIAGLGGQGVVRASDILADAAFRAGMDIKKSELHGMSQRGGSVSSDVRFGQQVLSPMIPEGSADFLVVISPDQVENNVSALKTGGTLIGPDAVDARALTNAKSINVALLGVLSASLSLPESAWLDALAAGFRPELHEGNRQAFQLGRESRKTSAHENKATREK
jgi:indolepyruvate ferredoxin oxidoreductase, beta subunit